MIAIRLIVVRTRDEWSCKDSNPSTVSVYDKAVFRPLEQFPDVLVQDRTLTAIFVGLTGRSNYSGPCICQSSVPLVIVGAFGLSLRHSSTLVQLEYGRIEHKWSGTKALTVRSLSWRVARDANSQATYRFTGPR
jgi:hypothetical protein